MPSNRRKSQYNELKYEVPSTSTIAAIKPSPPLLLSISNKPTMSTPIRLLVCSIGNPGAYLSTLHSAGHTVLSGLRGALSYPTFQKSQSHGNGLISAGPEFTLWQSPSLMNVSGPPLVAAWRQFVRDEGADGARLVVVHDELEAALGSVKVKKGGGSARGHNGLKSIEEALCGTRMGDGAWEYVRIGIGIGRPASRDSSEVADYVLRKVTPQEKAKVEACVGRVEEELRRIMDGMSR
jgi:peptidyl-tRNA hydrolase, PTH1 family